MQLEAKDYAQHDKFRLDAGGTIALSQLLLERERERLHVQNIERQRETRVGTNHRCIKV